MYLSTRIFLKFKKIIEDHKLFFATIGLTKRNTHFTKFIILTRSRTGSNLLVSYLNNHTNIYMRGEVFHKLSNRDPQKVLEKYFRIQPQSIHASGFKIFYYHPLDGPCEQLWELLKNDNSIKIIHLYRKNLINTLVSRKIALKTNAWSSEKKSNLNKKIYVNPVQLENEIKKTIQWQNVFNKLFQEHNIFHLYYEDFIKDQNKTLENIQNFLNIPINILNTHLKKQQKKRLDKVILNHDELKKYFSNTEWGIYFK